MKALIYTKANCTYCVKAKALFTIKNIQYVETVIGEDILREDFISLFPDVRSVPLIFIDGERIGGYDEFTKYLDAKRDA
jgi:glutaredoxin